MSISICINEANSANPLKSSRQHCQQRKQFYMHVNLHKESIPFIPSSLPTQGHTYEPRKVFPVLGRASSSSSFRDSSIWYFKSFNRLQSLFFPLPSHPSANILPNPHSRRLVGTQRLCRLAENRVIEIS